MSCRMLSLPALFMLLFLMSCATTSTKAPPQELLDSISQTEAIVEQASKLSGSDTDAVRVRSLLDQARSSMDSGNYSEAMKKARAARLEAERYHARATYDVLMSYNPPNTYTYHYRQKMKDSDDAMARRDIDGAIAAAREAREQAELALRLQQECMKAAEDKLAEMKKELEHIYQPDWTIEMLYWDSLDALPEKNCEKSKQMVGELERRVAQTKANTISLERRILVVTSPAEFVRIYGDPVMYAEVTSAGLKTEINRVPVGQPVAFINSLMVARNRVYYYVEDPRNGIKGWMAEERVWPDRAMRRK